MRIFDKDKLYELKDPDLTLGYLQDDTLFIAHHAAVSAIEEQGHWNTIRKYPNGGKDVEWIVDVPAVEAKEAYDEYENIKVYIPYTESELKKCKANELRLRREIECFPIINRGELWYAKLTTEQKSELSNWYEEWLDAPATLIIPEPPEWLKTVTKQTD